MADTNMQSDLETLKRLNADYLASDQNGDVQRYEELLADDFMASLPDFRLRDKQQFLEMMADPRPFTDLKADDVQVRLLGDFAVIHAHMTFRTLDGMRHQGRYTDDYQRRDGRWQYVVSVPRTSSPRDCRRRSWPTRAVSPKPRCSWRPAP